MSEVCRCVDAVLELLGRVYRDEAEDAIRRGAFRAWYRAEGRRILELIDDLLKVYEGKCV